MLSTRPRHLEGLESGRFADVQSGAALLEGNTPKPARRTILVIPPQINASCSGGFVLRRLRMPLPRLVQAMARTSALRFPAARPSRVLPSRPDPQ